MASKTAEYSRRYRERHPERFAEQQKRWQEANREKLNAKSRRWRLANPEKAKETDRRGRVKAYARKRQQRSFHSPEYFRAQLDVQGHACAICRKPFKGSQDMQADHDHLLCAPRGVLCTRCNVDLGRVEHDRLQRLLAYVDEWRARNVITYEVRTGAPDGH